MAALLPGEISQRLGLIALPDHLLHLDRWVLLLLSSRLLLPDLVVRSLIGIRLPDKKKPSLETLLPNLKPFSFLRPNRLQVRTTVLFSSLLASVEFLITHPLFFYWWRKRATFSDASKLGNTRSCQPSIDGALQSASSFYSTPIIHLGLALSLRLPTSLTCLHANLLLLIM